MAISMDAIIRNSTPVTAPLDMPRQDLGRAPKVRFGWQGVRTLLARLITFGGAIALTWYAGLQMYLIVSLDQVTVLQWGMLVLFVLTFGWIALGACGAVAGVFFGGGRYHAKPDATPNSLTVLLMPVYNEDSAQTFAGLYAMGKALAEQQLGKHVEIFVISDSTDPAKWIQETTAYHELRMALAGSVKVWYRRRLDNRGKKAGNVHDFISQWGGRYDHMVVLDADSIMDAGTIKTLICEMEADPDSGILQTLPRLYGGRTLFARMQQFAGAVYGPVVARGITAWQGNDGNYWGHNAIIRIEAFACAAGLPCLPGRRPFGGEVMSHDFVEAALIRRAGWSVRMLPELTGSWEESPPSLLDMAKRDRRWAQGNMQHLAVLKARGLRWPNRVHMLIGVMSYLSSPLWLALLAVGTVVATHGATQHFSYFTEEFQLFPHWPQFDSERMITLFIVTMGVLMLPKALGLLRGFFSREVLRASWPLSLSLSAVLETALSVLYAPICMLIHTRQVWEIFSGQDSGWEAQQRGHRSVPWGFLLRMHWVHTLIGAGLSVGLYWMVPLLLPWMAPALLGLALAIPLSALSGSVLAGTVLRKLHLLRINTEVALPEVVTLRDIYAARLEAKLRTVDLSRLLSDGELRGAHCLTLQPPTPPQRGQPDLDKVAAAMKIAEAESIDEAMDWLTRQELLAVLGEPRLMGSLATRRKTGEDSVAEC